MRMIKETLVLMSEDGMQRGNIVFQTLNTEHVVMTFFRPDRNVEKPVFVQLMTQWDARTMKNIFDRMFE